MEGVETTEAAQPQVREDPRESRSFWQRWIEGAKKAAKDHWADAALAWAEYENARPSADKISDPQFQGLRTNPIYWSSCKTIESALYAGTPQTDTKRLWDVSDPVALTASLITERLGDHFTRVIDFDSVMQKAVQDLIHADKTTTQALYKASKETFIAQNGQEYPVKQEITCAPILYDAVLHTPDAENPSDITEMAYKFCMTREEAEGRFPGLMINWKSAKDPRENEKRLGQDMPGEYLDGWECWSKATKRVYWFSDQHAEGLLDAKDDPYRLRGFFPSPSFIIGSRPARHLYPTPAFLQCKPIVDQMHELVRKTFKLIKAIRRRALVDNSDPKLIAALNDLSDNEFVACEGVRALVEKGGLESMIFYIPVQELVANLGELDQLEEKFKNKFFEAFGIPDVLRGVSDPEETAKAQGIKRASAYGRFEYPIMQIAKLASDTIEMMIDLALGVYPDEKIMQITGFNYMDPEDQQRFPEALALSRQDEVRIVRVHISTDQLSSWARQIKQQEKNAIAEVVINGLSSISQQQDPAFVNVQTQILLKTLEQMEGGKEFSDEVKAATDALMQKLQAPPPEPGPDYEMLKIQNDQKKIDIDGMKAQVDSFAKQREVERKDYETQLKAREQQMTEQVAMVEVQLKQVESALSQRIQEFTEFIGQQQLQLEQYKTALVEREKLIEEQRLSMDAQIEQVKLAMPSQEQPIQQPTIVQMPPMEAQPLNITINMPKKGTARVLRDPMTGDITGVTEDEPLIPVLGPSL